MSILGKCKILETNPKFVEFLNFYFCIFVDFNTSIAISLRKFCFHEPHFLLVAHSMGDMLQGNFILELEWLCTGRILI